MTRKHPLHDTHLKESPMITETEFYTRVRGILDSRDPGVPLRKANDMILALASELTIARDRRNRQTLRELVAARQNRELSQHDQDLIAAAHRDGVDCGRRLCLVCHQVVAA